MPLELCLLLTSNHDEHHKVILAPQASWLIHAAKRKPHMSHSLTNPAVHSGKRIGRRQVT